MPDQTVVAESSSAPVMEVDRGPMVNWNSDQRAEFRRTGTMPEPPKKDEDPAPSDPAKEPTSEPAGDPEAPKKPQEGTDKGRQRKPDAEQRIKALTDESKRLKAELEALKTKPEPSTQPKPQAETPKPQPQQVTRPKPTAEDKDDKGNPKYATYEDFVEELADWKAEQRWSAQQRTQAEQSQAKELGTKVEDARTRYGAKFDEILMPTVNAIVSDNAVSPSVKAMLNDSEILPDLIFTIGSDPKELASFQELARKNPGKALRYIALTESLIREELEAGKEKPAERTASAPPKTSAPKPPSEVGGRAATPNDPLESAAKAGDFRRYKAEAARRDLARMKG